MQKRLTTAWHKKETTFLWWQNKNYWLVKLVTAYRNPGMVVCLKPSQRCT